jgi:tRNA(Leu) C34 or U34 (ribose-2'-O)-methylase TrmL
MPGQVRSLNLANAVSVVLYEGLRRLGVSVPSEAPLATDGEVS